MDRGSEFGAHRINEDGSWDSEFRRHVEEPEWFRTRKRFRNEFETFEDFVQWYTRRPHGALKLEELESPENTFWNRLSIEAKFRIGVRLFGL